MQKVTMYYAAVLLLVIAGLAALFSSYRAHAPQTAPAATTTPATVGQGGAGATTTAPTAFPVNPKDTIASWQFAGQYAASDVLIASAKADIAKLAGLRGTGTYSDYTIDNGIANDYTNLGDGRKAYELYNDAINLNPQKGLAYVNLANLMQQLHAYETAADAYAKAAHVEPGTLQYHIDRLLYLTSEFPNDKARVSAAFVDAGKVFGDTPQVLSIEAKWFTKEGRYADAISAWQGVKNLLSLTHQDTSAVDAEIARLQSLQ